MSLAQKKAKFSKDDWSEAYTILGQVGLRGRIQRLVLLATMVFGPETFSIKQLHSVINYFSGAGLTANQIGRGLNPLFKKGFLQYMVVQEAYDPSVFTASRAGELVQRRYYYPREVACLADETRALLGHETTNTR